MTGGSRPVTLHRLWIPRYGTLVKTDRTATAAALAATVLERCDALAGFSEEPGRLTRRFATDALRQAGEAVAGWMRAAGMAVRHDAIGNSDRALRGAGRPRRRCCLARIWTPCATPASTTARSACWSRWPASSACTTPAGACRSRSRCSASPTRRACATIPPTWAAASSRARSTRPTSTERRRRHHDGRGDPRVWRRPRAAWPARGATRPACSATARCISSRARCWRRATLPVGVVTAIAGQSRCAVSFAGVAGHAGTVPMEPAARCAVRRGRVVAGGRGAGARTSRAWSPPSASSPSSQARATSSPAAATLSLDVRHQRRRARARRPRERLRERAAQIARRARRRAGLAASCRRARGRLRPGADASCWPRRSRRRAPRRRLPSGAGHDGVVLAAI